MHGAGPVRTPVTADHAVRAVGDRTDPAVAWFRDLRDARARARLEADAGVFVAEGVETVRRVLRSGVRVRTVLLLPRRVDSLALDAAGAGAEVLVAEPDVYNDVVGFDAHRGVLAVCDRPPAVPFSSVCDTADRIVVLEGIGDAENLGVLLRNAAAFGAGAVVLDPTCADPWARRAVRVSMGNVAAVPLARVTAWPSALHRLRDGGVELVALTPAGDTPISAWRPRGRVALLLGAEGPGLSDGALGAADLRARIEMAPGVDSLNVAAAAAVALHHVWTADSAGAAPGPDGSTP